MTANIKCYISKYRFDPFDNFVLCRCQQRMGMNDRKKSEQDVWQDDFLCMCVSMSMSMLEFSYYIYV